MRPAERRHVLVLLGERCEPVNEVDELPPEDQERVAIDYQVRIIGDVAACRAEVDDLRRIGALLCVGVDVRHDIVTELLLELARVLEIDVVLVRAQFSNLLFGDGFKAEFMFRLRERDPDSAPGAELFQLREILQHLPAGEPLGERG